jgi:hypothetical protein
VAADQFRLAAVDDGVVFEQRHHTVNVSYPLPVNQQALEILRIAGGFAVWLISHGKTPPSAIAATLTEAKAGFDTSNRFRGLPAPGSVSV